MRWQILKKSRLSMAAALVFLPVILLAEDLPIEFKFTLSHQNALETKRSAAYDGFGMPYLGLPDSVNGGFGLSAAFNYRITDAFRAGIKIGYDYMHLYQRDVLDEWDWDYWEKTYIEFIPGLTVEEANKTLRYNAGTDSTQFSAVFEPVQRLKELKISTQAEYHLPVYKELSAVLGLEFGASLFSRQMEMHEHWIKRYQLDPESTEKYDYEYKFELLHFAPPKTGVRFFLAPAIGVNFDLNDAMAVTADFIYVQYLGHQQVGWLEDLLRIPADSEKWFPVKSKFLISLGLVLKY